MESVHQFLAPLYALSGTLSTVGLVAVLASMFLSQKMSWKSRRRLNTVIIVVSIPLCLLGVLSALSGSPNGLLSALVWGANGYMSWKRR